MIKFVNKTKVEKVYKPFAIYKSDKIMIIKQYSKPGIRFKEDIKNTFFAFLSIFLCVFLFIKEFIMTFVHLVPLIVIIKEDK